MLELFNDLEPFIEDCYQEYGVREYARLRNISAPTASKLLHYYEEEGLLKKRHDRNLILFRANPESTVLQGLACIYWEQKLINITNYLEESFFSSGIVLFGSLPKLETRKESDIDLAIFSSIKKHIDLSAFEKKLKRKIQIFQFKNLAEIPEELRQSIINGFRLHGELR